MSNHASQGGDGQSLLTAVQDNHTPANQTPPDQSLQGNRTVVNDDAQASTSQDVQGTAKQALEQNMVNQPLGDTIRLPTAATANQAQVLPTEHLVPPNPGAAQNNQQKTIFTPTSIHQSNPQVTHRDESQQLLPDPGMRQTLSSTPCFNTQQSPHHQFNTQQTTYYQDITRQEQQHRNQHQQYRHTPTDTQESQDLEFRFPFQSRPQALLTRGPAMNNNNHTPTSLSTSHTRQLTTSSLGGSSSRTLPQHHQRHNQHHTNYSSYQTTVSKGTNNVPNLSTYQQPPYLQNNQYSSQTKTWNPDRNNIPNNASIYDEDNITEATKHGSQSKKRKSSGEPRKKRKVISNTVGVIRGNKYSPHYWTPCKHCASKKLKSNHVKDHYLRHHPEVQFADTQELLEILGYGSRSYKKGNRCDKVDEYGNKLNTVIDQTREDTETLFLDGSEEDDDQTITEVRNMPPPVVVDADAIMRQCQEKLEKQLIKHLPPEQTLEEYVARIRDIKTDSVELTSLDHSDNFRTTIPTHIINRNIGSMIKDPDIQSKLKDKVCLILTGLKPVNMYDVLENAQFKSTVCQKQRIFEPGQMAHHKREKIEEDKNKLLPSIWGEQGAVAIHLTDWRDLEKKLLVKQRLEGFTSDTHEANKSDSFQHYASCEYDNPVAGNDELMANTYNNLSHRHASGNQTWLSSRSTRTLKWSTQVQGVTSAYCIIGSSLTYFGSHTEDVYLLSANRTFAGMKRWFMVPPSTSRDFEEYVKCKLNLPAEQNMLTRDTMFIPSEREVKAFGIVCIVQRPHELVIVNSKVLHWGYNFSSDTRTPMVCEAINLAQMSEDEHISLCMQYQSNIKQRIMVCPSQSAGALKNLVTHWCNIFEINNDLYQIKICICCEAQCLCLMTSDDKDRIIWTLPQEADNGDTWFLSKGDGWPMLGFNQTRAETSSFKSKNELPTFKTHHTTRNVTTRKNSTPKSQHQKQNTNNRPIITINTGQNQTTHTQGRQNKTTPNNQDLELANASSGAESYGNEDVVNSSEEEVAIRTKTTARMTAPVLIQTPALDIRNEEVD